MRLKVATFNIHHAVGMDGKLEIDRISAEILKMNADVIALQEVDRFHPRSYLHDQLRRIGRKLDMKSAFAPSINFGLVQYGNGILSRYPILSKQVVYLQGVNERRSILSVRVDTPDEPCTIVNIHLGVMEREREQQFPYLLNVLRSIDGHGILLGDFNMGAQHPFLDQLHPTWSKVAPEPFAPTVRSGREIDHIYTKLPLKKQQAYVQATDASDHHAVVAQLEW
ncbi:endonuclease/exonuclease/phosphatase family protein [Gorillibacterium timonense]|uniref:endonuclease/exonuclease/phosphatase family protein n=1 Tax=Gorillibacterium timonense TaxID=1689269 RepID=UPI00071DBE2D|nr:endonuclease/exonuclease/phosphatase family protein [Gorillibacterium timonense]